jgi:4'-phosphopantetheinyl transferase EntD
MPLFLKHNEEKYQWGIWKISECVEELLTLLPNKGEYEQAVQSFTAVHRCLEWLSVRVLLHTLLGEEKKIAYHPNGKPYLPDGGYIGISHTRGYAAVILSDVMEVGIDIEQYGERIRRVSHKFMCSDECLSTYCNSDIRSLLLHWSAKEVMFKCMDMAATTVVNFRKDLRIYPFQTREYGTFQGKEYCTSRERNFLIHYCVYAEFVVTWTSFTPSL